MRVRAGIFFVALVVLMVATFEDAAAMVSPWIDPRLLYVPAALIVAGLLFHARVPPRLPENPAWYGVLGALAIAVAAAPFLAFPYLNLAAEPLLLIGVVLVMLRLKPRIGYLYQSGLVPGFLTFLTFSALLWQSHSIVGSLAAVGVTHPMIERLPGLANLAAAAILVAIFITASGIRQRSLQLNPSRSWLTMGLLLFIAGAFATHFPAYAQYGRYALIAAHVLLFVGATYLLSHLLPRRAADEMA